MQERKSFACQQKFSVVCEGKSFGRDHRKMIDTQGARAV